MQGARGTALTGDAPSARTRTGLVAAVVAVVVVLDQVTKAVAVAALEGRTVELLGGVLDLVLVRNPGAAFSLGTSATVVLSLLAATVLVVIAVVARRPLAASWALVLGLVAGGAGGNLVDRLTREPGFLRGAVVDFLRLPNWPVFNVADVALTTGAVLGVLLSIRGIGLDGRRDAD